MIISHKYKFIYFKEHKVAGTSTEILLGNICGDNDIVTPIMPKVERVKGSRNADGFKNHSHPSEVRSKIGEEKFNSYYKFNTIRNPFDRVVSWYWMRCSFTGNKSFKDFVLLGLNGLRPFYDVMFLNNECVLDDHIRYENLENDTKRILGKWFDVDDIQYPIAKTSQRKSKKHYTEYYDEETKQLVAEKYRKDIEYFNYEFGE